MRAFIVVTIVAAALGPETAMAQAVATPPGVLPPTIVTPNELLSPSEQQALGLENSLVQEDLGLDQSNQAEFNTGLAGTQAAGRTPTAPITGLATPLITGIEGQ